MQFWEYKDTGESEVKEKGLFERSVPMAHYIYRNFLGAVDQRDVKSHVMAITRERVARWHQKQLRFAVECAISAAHSNYNLDPTVTPEFFKEWYNQFVEELLVLSKNYRKRKIMLSPKKKNYDSPKEKKTPMPSRRPHKKKTQTPRKRHRKKTPYGYATEEGLNCYGREYLMRCLNFSPVEGTELNSKPKARRLRCNFCGKEGVLYSCGACNSVFCMRAPVHLINPTSNPRRKFRTDGLFCWQLVHGYKTKSELRY